MQKININSKCALLFLTPNFVFSAGIPTVMGWAQAQDEQGYGIKIILMIAAKKYATNKQVFE